MQRSTPSCTPLGVHGCSVPRTCCWWRSIHGCAERVFFWAAMSRLAVGVPRTRSFCMDCTRSTLSKRVASRHCCCKPKSAIMTRHGTVPTTWCACAVRHACLRGWLQNLRRRARVWPQRCAAVDFPRVVTGRGRQRTRQGCCQGCRAPQRCVCVCRFARQSTSRRTHPHPPRRRATRPHRHGGTGDVPEQNQSVRGVRLRFFPLQAHLEEPGRARVGRARENAHGGGDCSSGQGGHPPLAHGRCGAFSVGGSV